MVAVVGGVSHEIYDALGHQRGWEILTHGVDEPLIRFPTFVDFALALGREAVEVAAAPVLPTSDGDVVVVTDPHYNTLVSHEIIGHPVELDRALKMETAYAGRSWLLRGLERAPGRQAASPRRSSPRIRIRRCPATATTRTTTRARRPGAWSTSSGASSRDS